MSSYGDSEPDVPTRRDRKSYINFPRASSYMTTNYYQLERKVTSVHISCDPTALYACETRNRTVMIAHRLDVMRRAGLERLQYIVTTRRRKMAGRKNSPYSNVRGDRRRQDKHGETEEDMTKHFQGRPGRDGCQPP